MTWEDPSEVSDVSKNIFLQHGETAHRFPNIRWPPHPGNVKENQLILAQDVLVHIEVKSTFCPSNIKGGKEQLKSFRSSGYVAIQYQTRHFFRVVSEESARPLAVIFCGRMGTTKAQQKFVLNFCTSDDWKSIDLVCILGWGGIFRDRNGLVCAVRYDGMALLLL